MSNSMNIGPNELERDPKRVCALLYDGLSTFEFSIAAEVFGLPRPEFGEDWYAFDTASEEGRPVRANGGIAVVPSADLSAVCTAGTILLPGWRTEDETPSPAVRRALLGAWEGGARFVSICSGAFLLAALGLLDARRATTHWLYAGKLAVRYPSITVDADVLFVDEDRILTSAGSAAGIDLLLHVVRKDFGAERANAVARRMVMPAHREGDQRQFVAAPVAMDTDRLRPLLDKVRGEPDRRWSIDALADEAAMSRRTFTRRFREATGQSPSSFVSQARLSAARVSLEATNASLDDVAASAGFGSLAAMNHHFGKVLGCTAAAYRRRFRRQV